MHDYFDILGVSRDARPNDIRRACCRRVHATHPDVWDGDARPEPFSGLSASRRAVIAHDSDAAIDFLDVTTLVEAMRAAFFHAPPS